MLFVPMFLSAALFATAAGAAATAADKPQEAAKPAPTTRPAVEPRTASLADAVSDWVGLLELDFANAPAAAARRWAKDGKAADELRQLWPDLQKRHAKYDYHKWATGEHRPANDPVAGDAQSFTVGGHEYGHLHTRWVKTDAGWRIESVFMCR
jgi:hypothetical protein